MNRFLFHLLPVLLLLMALGIESLVRSIRGVHRTSVPVESTVCVVIALLGIWPLMHQDQRQIAHLGMYGSHLRNAHIRLAEALTASNVPPALRTLTVGDAGAIPYFTDWHCYDFVGLNDEVVAHEPERRSSYIAEARPSVMILYSQSGQPPRPEQFGFEPDAMLPEYREAAYVQWFPDYYLEIFLRSDLPEPVYFELWDRINRVAEEAQVDNAALASRKGLIAHLIERARGG